MNSFPVTYTFFGVIVLCFQVPVSYTRFATPVTTTQHQADFSQCSPKLVNCACGATGSTVSIPLNQCSVFKESQWSCEICEGQDEATICAAFINCQTCSAEATGRCITCPEARGGTLCDIVLGCQTLTSPVNGEVQPPNTSPFGFKEGAEVTYSCNNGFTLTAGSITRECRKDGTWSGVEPVCVENSVITSSPAPTKSQSCPEPETPENGRIDVQLDLVTYKCIPNFSLQGVGIRQCINGVWTGSSPLCVQKEASQCPMINPITGAKIIITQQIDSSMFVRREEEVANKHLGPFPDGTQLDITCDSKVYNLIGRSKIKCTNGIWSDNPPICQPICGRSSLAPVRQIVNGTASSVGQWPWAVSIKFKVDVSNWDFICGGSLISERMVLTAAHCVTDRDSGVKLPVDSYKLYAGKHYTDDSRDDTEVQIRIPFKMFLHPDFNHRNLDSDIAIMQVLPGFQLTIRVQPVCLPIEITIKTGQNATVIGWGKTEKREVSPELNYAQLTIVSHEKCKDEYGAKGAVVTDNMICAGLEQGGRDSCNGDSGGPLVLPSSSNAHIWSIIGVVSWGGLEGNECGDASAYSIYTKVKNYIDWISDFI